MLPVLPHPVVVVPVAYAAALAAAGALAAADPHPVAACRRTLHAAREHTAHAAVTVALALACTSHPTPAPGIEDECPECRRPHNPKTPCPEGPPR
jgi:hypothetical protein